MDFLASIGLSETVIQFMLVNAILGLSIYVTLHTGMFTLANAGFMAIGAYVGVILTQQAEWSFWSALVGAMLGAGLVAIPIGLPVLRLRDIYLAIATIGFGEVVRIVLLNFDGIVSSVIELTTGERTRYVLVNGARGIRGIPKVTETWHLVLVLVLIGYVLYRLNRSRFGRAMAAIRQDEVAAANAGVDVVYVKNVVFIIGAMIAGAGGMLSGHLTRIITPDAYGFNQAVDILAYAVLGGTSTFIGPIVGGMVLGALPEVLRFLQQYRGVFNGLVLLLVIVYLPGGLVNPSGIVGLWRNRRRRLADAQEAGR
jgi:branched-chain amino acid transport system permease protein